MEPRKKKPTITWVGKSQQPKHETEKMKSPLFEELPLSSNTVSNSEPTSKDDTLFKPDWSLLPEELLHLISQKLDDCFDVIHARSVCHSWRSIFPFPSCLLRESYSLPSFSQYLRRFNGVHAPSCTLEKFHMFLFRVRRPAGVAELPAEVFFMGGINQDKSEDNMELRSPFQCSLKVNIPGSEPILLNVLDCQILPLGYQFRMVGWDPPRSLTFVAFLPLDEEGKEFAVLISDTQSRVFLALRSSEMRWMRLEEMPTGCCHEIVTFRGKFYVNIYNKDLFVIDPYSLKSTPLKPVQLPPLMATEDFNWINYLVSSGNDELFLVQRNFTWNTDGNYFTNLLCRVCRLDEDAGEWVVTTDLGDRVLLVGGLGSGSFSAEEPPHGFDVNGNSILFTEQLVGDIKYFYKSGVDAGNAEDNLNLWRCSREIIVGTILDTLPMVVYRAERSTP